MDMTIFEKLARSFDDFAGRFKEARAEHVTAETLVATAEYELDQVKQLFAENKLVR